MNTQIAAAKLFCFMSQDLVITCICPFIHIGSFRSIKNEMWA